MRLLQLLITSSILGGLFLLGSRNSLKQSPERLLKDIEIHYLAIKQSLQLALEKSHSLSLHEIVQSTYESMSDDSHAEFSPANIALSNQIQTLAFNGQNIEQIRFDEAYVSHQLKACREIIGLIESAINAPSITLKETALKKLAVITPYQSSLRGFNANFPPVNELQIREIAHEIWEAEGKPEGKAEHHWRLAIELLRKIPPDQKLVF